MKPWPIHVKVAIALATAISIMVLVHAYLAELHWFSTHSL